MVAKADVKPVPTQKPLTHKPPKLIALQIIKRWRDLIYASGRRAERKPPSILLAKLIADTNCSAVGLHATMTTVAASGPNCHWSATKQDALADQFLDVARRLGGLGVQQVHLFVAAPNSLAFRLGRAYDQRNLPPAHIYQYEQSDTPPFPWAVILPTHGQAFPA